jgi:hypothetical protein
MQNITCVLLIDKRLANYDEIIASANAVTACVVFDYELDTFDTLRTRGIDRITPENRVVCTWIADVEVESEPTTEPKQQQQQQQQQVREYHNIGLMQHNTNGSQYFAMANEPGCQLDNVAESDPSLETWVIYINFINKCARDYGMQTYDMMACALYSDANWKYAIDEMAVRCGGVSIRASLDNTGAANLRGDWFLLASNASGQESALEITETVDLTTVYFTDEILNYKFVLALTRVSIPDFYASYGSNTTASSFTLNGWSIYSSVGTYNTEGLSNLIKPSATYVAGFLSDKVTIGITGPTPFRIDSITWGADHILNRTPKTVKMYGSNISYLGNISSSIISSNATLIDTFSFQRVSEQTVPISSTLYYSSYYFDVLDNWGDPSTKISGIVFMADYTMSSAVYESTFTSHTFTNAGATGRTGPILSAVRSAYFSAVWAQDTTNNWLSMSGDNGIQLWTVPKTGKYTIDAYGGGTPCGGAGGRIKGDFALTKGSILSIVCGQVSISGTWTTGGWFAEGGGGGTYVCVGDRTKANMLCVAGGGGGSASDNSANLRSDGSKYGGWSVSVIGDSDTGGAALGGNGSGSGGGISSDGFLQSPQPGTITAKCFGNASMGGYNTNNPIGVGGFGGGGNGGGNPGGGGGGFRGGDTGSGDRGGQGGTSYILASATNTSNTIGGSGISQPGRVIITLLLTSPATLTFNKTAFYVKYVLNSTISIPAALISTNNTDSYTVAHSSGSTGIATVSTSANVGTVTVKGLGTTTITSTLAATANFDAVTVTSITITVIGSGSYVTGATMTSIDLSETDLTGSVLSSCDLTSANLYGATFNAATDLHGSTLTSLKSGRIIGFTTLLPMGYKMI